MKEPDIIKYSEWNSALNNGMLTRYISDVDAKKINTSFSIVGTLIQPTISEAETCLLKFDVDGILFIVEWKSGYFGLTVGDKFYVSGTLIDRQDGHGICLIANVLRDITFLENKAAEKSVNL